MWDTARRSGATIVEIGSSVLDNFESWPIDGAEFTLTKRNKTKPMGIAWDIFIYAGIVFEIIKKKRE
jgi:hypothetical protein